MYNKNRRILNASGTASCEICKEVNILIQHHIEGRKIFNANKQTNLANICSNCHLEIHRGLIVIEKKILTTAGYMLLWHYKNEESISGDNSTPHIY